MNPGTYRKPEVLSALNESVAKLIQSGVRLARTGQAITGCIIKLELVDIMAKAYEELGTNVGDHYSSELRNGHIVPLVPISDNGDRLWKCGELFFTS